MSKGHVHIPSEHGKIHAYSDAQISWSSNTDEGIRARPVFPYASYKQTPRQKRRVCHELLKGSL